MKTAKATAWRSVIYAIMYMILGGITIVFPEQVADFLCYALGGTMILVGAIIICFYLFRKAEQNYASNDFVFGLIAIVLGILVIVRVNLFTELLPYLLGVIVLVSGFIKLQNCIDIRRYGAGNGVALLVLAAINIAMGIVLLVNPFDAAKLLFVLLGVGMVFSGLTDLIITIYVARKVQNRKKEAETVDSEGGYREISSERADK